MSDFLIPTNILEDNTSFPITVVTMTGKRINISVCLLDKIYHIKQLIYKEDDILIDQQRLVFNGKELENESIVKDVGITTNSSLHLILRIRGGMFHSSSSRNDYLSLDSKIKRDKTFAMIRHMRDKYDVVELMDEIHGKLIKCSTDAEIDKIYILIKKYYIE